MPDGLLVASLNCLGEAFNPFEFLSESNEDCCEQLEIAARALTFEVFAEASGSVLSSGASPTGAAAALGRLRAHVDCGKSLWSFFDEPTLANDNKFLDERLNLVTFAMRTHEGQLQFELLDRWQAEVNALVPTSSAYSTDANLWLWDVACNVIATRQPAAYRAVCRSSALNPRNFEAQGATFIETALAAAGDGTPIVVGVQEWPRGGTLKGDAYGALLEMRHLRLLRPGAGEDGVGLVYSNILGEAIEITECAALAQQTMQSCLNAANAASAAGAEPPRIDAKTAKGFLSTTARKVLALRFLPPSAAAGHVFLVVHAKEPKSAAAARVLADFMLELGGQMCQSREEKLVIMSDTNLGSAALAEQFAAQLGVGGFMAMPPPAVPTTAKMRSILHGQCYDAKKCGKLVMAPKDKVIAIAASLTGPATFPELGVDGAGGGLPSASWASDHCLTHARLAVDCGPSVAPEATLAVLDAGLSSESVRRGIKAAKAEAARQRWTKAQQQIAIVSKLSAAAQQPKVAPTTSDSVRQGIKAAKAEAARRRLAKAQLQVVMSGKVATAFSTTARVGAPPAAAPHPTPSPKPPLGTPTKPQTATHPSAVGDESAFISELTPAKKRRGSPDVHAPNVGSHVWLESSADVGEPFLQATTVPTAAGSNSLIVRYRSRDDEPSQEVEVWLRPDGESLAGPAPFVRLLPRVHALQAAGDAGAESPLKPWMRTVAPRQVRATFAPGATMGLALSQDGGIEHVIVTDVLVGSPAAAQGVPLNSILACVNGQSTAGLSKAAVCALVDAVDGDRHLTFTEATAAAMSPRASYATRQRPMSQIADVCELPKLNDAELMHHLRTRYKAQMVHTWMGRTLLVITPRRAHALLYSADQRLGTHLASAAQYLEAKQPLPPHILAVAEEAYRGANRGVPQAVVFCGTSATGKSDCARHVLEYLTWRAGDADGSDGGALLRRLHAADALLTAFGGASTSRHRNASCFGKSTELNFAFSGGLRCAHLRTFLLEKSRVVRRRDGESSFHVLHALVHAARHKDDANATLPVAAPPENGTGTDRGVDGEPPSPLADLGKQLTATVNNLAKLFKPQSPLEDLLDTLRLGSDRTASPVSGGAASANPLQSKESLHGVYASLVELLDDTSVGANFTFRVLAAVLHLGNVVFSRAAELSREDGGGISDRADDAALSADADASLELAEQLLYVPKHGLRNALLRRQSTLGTRSGRLQLSPVGSVEVGRTAAGASRARDSCMQTVYALLFDWLVVHLNQAIGPREERGWSHRISLLDAIGFEGGASHGFGELVANYTNERLLQVELHAALRAQAGALEAEGLVIESADVPASVAVNDGCVMLVRGVIGPILESICAAELQRTESGDGLLQSGAEGHSSADARLCSELNRMRDQGAASLLPLGTRAKEYHAFLVHHYAADVLYRGDGFVDANLDTRDASVLAALATSTSPLLLKLLRMPAAAPRWRPSASPLPSPDVQLESAASAGCDPGPGGVVVRFEAWETLGVLVHDETRWRMEEASARLSSVGGVAAFPPRRVLIGGLVPGGRAEAMGTVHKGMVVVAVNGARMDSAAHVKWRIARARANALPISLTLAHLSIEEGRPDGSLVPRAGSEGLPPMPSFSEISLPTPSTPPPPASTSTLAPHVAPASSPALAAVALPVANDGGDEGGTDAPAALKSGSTGVLARYESELGELCTLLEASSTCFVHCLTPSAHEGDDTFEPRHVLAQLRAIGGSELAAVHREAYPVRVLIEELAKPLAAVSELLPDHTWVAARERYSSVQRMGTFAGMGTTPEASGDASAGTMSTHDAYTLVAATLVAFNVDDRTYALGRCTLFLRASAAEFLTTIAKAARDDDEDAASVAIGAMRARLLEMPLHAPVATALQAAARGLLARRASSSLAIARDESRAVVKATMMLQALVRGRTGRLVASAARQHADADALARFAAHKGRTREAAPDALPLPFEHIDAAVVHPRVVKDAQYLLSEGVRIVKRAARRSVSSSAPPRPKVNPVALESVARRHDVGDELDDLDDDDVRGVALQSQAFTLTTAVGPTPPKDVYNTRRYNELLEQLKDERPLHRRYEGEHADADESLHDHTAASGLALLTPAATSRAADDDEGNQYPSWWFAGTPFRIDYAQLTAGEDGAAAAAPTISHELSLGSEESLGRSPSIERSGSALARRRRTLTETGEAPRLFASHPANDTHSKIGEGGKSSRRAGLVGDAFAHQFLLNEEKILKGGTKDEAVKFEGLTTTDVPRLTSAASSMLDEALEGISSRNASFAHGQPQPSPPRTGESFVEEEDTLERPMHTPLPAEVKAKKGAYAGKRWSALPK